MYIGVRQFCVCGALFVDVYGRGRRMDVYVAFRIVLHGRSHCNGRGGVRVFFVKFDCSVARLGLDVFSVRS